MVEKLDSTSKGSNSLTMIFIKKKKKNSSLCFDTDTILCTFSPSTFNLSLFTMLVLNCAALKCV